MTANYWLPTPMQEAFGLRWIHAEVAAFPTFPTKEHLPKRVRAKRQVLSVCRRTTRFEPGDTDFVHVGGFVAGMILVKLFAPRPAGDVGVEY